MATFEEAIPVVLANEGGYVFDAADPGGETNYGISKRSYPDVDIKNLTKDEASEIYRRDFWKFDGIISQAVATKLFDSFVNMRRYAIKFAQQVAEVTPVDGVYGPTTETQINAKDPAEFLSEYRDKLVQHYDNLVAVDPLQGKFLNGWLRRARQ